MNRFFISVIAVIWMAVSAASSQAAAKTNPWVEIFKILAPEVIKHIWPTEGKRDLTEIENRLIKVETGLRNLGSDPKAIVEIRGKLRHLTRAEFDQLIFEANNEIWAAIEELQERILFRSRSIDAYGGWPLVRGDTEMDTDGQDRVPIYCGTYLKIKDGKLVVLIGFSCAEDGGDRTRYSGNREFDVYVPPGGYELLGFDATGGWHKQFREHSVGPNHDFTTFKGIKKTYWDSLKYRVDRDGRDDDKYVGVGGTLSLHVRIRKK